MGEHDRRVRTLGACWAPLDEYFQPGPNATWSTLRRSIEAEQTDVSSSALFTLMTQSDTGSTALAGAAGREDERQPADRRYLQAYWGSCLLISQGGDVSDEELTERAQNIPPVVPRALGWTRRAVRKVSCQKWRLRNAPEERSGVSGEGQPGTMPPACEEPQETPQAGSGDEQPAGQWRAAVRRQWQMRQAFANIFDQAGAEGRFTEGAGTRDDRHRRAANGSLGQPTDARK